MCFLGFGGLCIHRKSTQGTAQRVLVSRELYLLLLVVVVAEKLIDFPTEVDFSTLKNAFIVSKEKIMLN
jgi:hypothetical protein